MAKSRGEFSSTFGFVMAAAGSAIGLGNIWGFPTQTAENGGAAFVLVYLVLAFFIGYPLLMAEFVIGRHANSNPVGAYRSIAGGRAFVPAGYFGIIVAGLILSFYSILAGWMVAYAVEPFLLLLGADSLAGWVVDESNLGRNILFTTIFYLMTIGIITGGVKSGIEKWSSRLMPTLIFMMILLTIYVLTLDGASEGLEIYLFPDFNKITDPDLILSALGQSFFSLSLGVGTMLVYGSYVGDREKLVNLGVYVTLADIGIAFLAGLLIIPAMYVAANAGTEIFDAEGNLISGPTLVFQILPELFNSMGPVGIPAALIFFVLMSIAALTSSISMLEVPVSYAVDTRDWQRKTSTWLIGGLFWIISIALVINFDTLFGFVVSFTTQYSQPLLGLVICIFIGWVMNRDTILRELQKGSPNVGNSIFMIVWPIFVRVISPLLIALVFLQSLNVF